MPTTDIVGNYIGFAHHALKERNAQFVAFMEAKVHEIEKRLRESGKIAHTAAQLAPDAALAALETQLPTETFTAATTAATDDLTNLAGALDRDPPRTLPHPPTATLPPRPILPDEFPADAPAPTPAPPNPLAREAALTAAAVQTQSQALLDPAPPKSTKLPRLPRKKAADLEH